MKWMPSAPSTGAGPNGEYTAGLRPDHVDVASPASALIPLYLQPRFLGIPSFIVLAFAAGWVGARRRRGSEEGESADRISPKAAKRLLAQMQVQARVGNAVAFFDSARTALQSSLAARWQLPPEEVTTAEVEARLGAQDEIRQLFALGDESKYSGRELNATDFARWLRIVRRHLMNEKSA